MKRSVIYLFAIMLFWNVGAVFSQTTTATAEDTVSAPNASTFEVIDRSHYDKIAAWLSDKGTVVTSATILSMGFEADATDPTAKKLAVIVMGANNQPEKRLFDVDNEFYEKYTGKKVIIGEVEGASSGNHLTNLTSVNKTEVGDPEDGRLYFMINTTARSLYVYPAGFAMATRDADGRIVSGLSLLSLGASLYGSYAFSKAIKLGYGRVEFMNYGADMGGIWFPALTQLAFDRDGYNNNPTIQSYFAMLGFPLGIYLGSKFTFADNYAYGNASMMTNLSRAAPLYGFLIPAIFMDFNHEIDIRNYVTTSSVLSIGLIPLGFYIGNKIVGDQDISSGRSIMTTSAGIFGALTGLVLPTLFESDQPRLYFATTLLGHVGGTAFGYYFKDGTPYTFSQGIFTTVSAIVGTGVGLAFPLLSKAENHRAYTLSGLAGCWGGFFLGEHLSLSMFEKSRHDNRSSTVSVSFPGLASLPILVMSQEFAGNNHKTSATHPSLFTPRVTLMDMRF